MTKDARVGIAAGHHAYIDFGGAGHDVLLVHQLTSNAEVWRPIGEALARVCHPVAIDLRGHGRTEAPDDDMTRVSADLAEVVVALGLRRPLLVMQQDEILALAPDRLAGIDHSGVVLVHLSSYARGSQAATEWLQSMGPDSLDVWDRRFSLFASGTREEKDAYLERTVAAATGDGTTGYAPPEQLRRYYERHIHETPDGWVRRPRREALENVLRSVADGPHGLDLLDEYDGPLWIVADDDYVLEDARAAVLAYAASRPDREVRFVRSGDVLQGLDPAGVAAVVAAMLEGPCRVTPQTA